MSINTCQTDNLQYILNTVGLGASCGLSIYSLASSLYFTARSATPRKLFVTSTAFALIITSTIFSSFLLDSRSSRTTSVLVASLVFLRLSVVLLSATSILRYTIFLSEKRRMLINHLLCGAVAVVVMFVFAVDVQSVVNQSDTVVEMVTFSSANAVQILIPALHVLLGIFSIYQSSKQKVGITVRSQKYLAINIGFSAIIILVWAAYLILVVLESKAVGFGVALLTLIIYLESNCAVLTETTAESPVGVPKR